MYFPVIDYKKCKNHGECFKICPEEVFDMDTEGVRVARRATARNARPVW